MATLVAWEIAEVQRHPGTRIPDARAGSGTVKPEHPLRRYYQSLLDKGTKPNLAQLTLARKLAAIVLAMWKNNEEFNAAMI